MKHAWLLLIGLLSVSACAARRDQSADEIEGALAADDATCRGVTKVFGTWDPELEAAAVEVLAPEYVLPEAGYRTRALVPGVVMFVHAGDFAQPFMRLFGDSQHMVSGHDGRIRESFVFATYYDGSGGPTAKALFEAMTRARETAVQGGTRRVSSNGAMRCVRGNDATYHCELLVGESELFDGAEWRVETTNTCSEQLFGE